jgi:hypothetical protein
VKIFWNAIDEIIVHKGIIITQDNQVCFGAISNFLGSVILDKNKSYVACCSKHPENRAKLVFFNAAILQCFIKKNAAGGPRKL